jgi:hypothetical protein
MRLLAEVYNQSAFIMTFAFQAMLVEESIFLKPDKFEYYAP